MEEAYGLYRDFLKSFPEYPDLLRIYRKLLPLAEQLKRPEEREIYQKEIERLTAKS